MRRRLAVLYCALFFPLGLSLIVITAVVTFSSSHPVVHAYLDGKPVAHLAPPGTGRGTEAAPPQDVHIGSLTFDLHEFVLVSCITLLAMIATSLLLGWLLAGRVLQPLRTITATTRNISEHDLHQRLALPGPHDDLTELGDTIDELLGRLERAFDSQRRFVANASHELRTPLAVERATLQVALVGPQPHHRLAASGLRRSPRSGSRTGTTDRRPPHPRPQPAGHRPHRTCRSRRHHP